MIDCPDLDEHVRTLSSVLAGGCRREPATRVRGALPAADRPRPPGVAAGRREDPGPDEPAGELGCRPGPNRSFHGTSRATLTRLSDHARILVTSSPWSLARSIPTVFTELVARGVELVFATQPGNDPLPAELGSDPRVGVVELPLGRDGVEAESVRLLRRLTDLNRFMDPALAESWWARRRTALRALVAAGHPDAQAAAAELASQRLTPESHAALTNALNGIERRLPPPRGLVEAVDGLELDAILLVSRCSLGGAERDVIKIARALDLPTTMLVWSWDNLSSKAILNEHPDRLLVWNERQVDEAVELHGFPRRTRACAGGAELRPVLRGARGGAGAPPPAERTQDDPLPGLVEEHLEGRARRLPRLGRRGPRPPGTRPFETRGSSFAHTRAAGGWRQRPPAPSEQFEIEPARKLEPDRLAALLVDADVVVALNTSAELEAAAAGMPVVTFRAGELAPGQEGSAHFEYLLEQHGGFVIDSRDLDEHVENLARVLRGDVDTQRLQELRRAFRAPGGTRASRFAADRRCGARRTRRGFARPTGSRVADRIAPDENRHPARPEVLLAQRDDGAGRALRAGSRTAARPAREQEAAGPRADGAVTQPHSLRRRSIRIDATTASTVRSPFCARCETRCGTSRRSSRTPMPTGGARTGSCSPRSLPIRGTEPPPLARPGRTTSRPPTPRWPSWSDASRRPSRSSGSSVSSGWTRSSASDV